MYRHPMRSGFIFSLCLIVAAVAAPAAEKLLRPNVLFIAVDDLRPELGCYGQTHIRSPHIDRLAKAGMVFKRAYCQQAVCAPSRASLMTGTRPDTTKVWDLVTHFREALPDVVTLGQQFKNHGYFVQGMGKIYHGGYDDAPTWSVPWQAPAAPSYVLPENLAVIAQQTAEAADPDDKPPGKPARPKARPRGPVMECADVPDDTYLDGKVAALAVETLRRMAAKPQPFFLAVGFARPHLPFVAPKKYWDLYDPATIPAAPNKFPPKDAPDYAILAGGEIRSYHGIPTRGSLPDGLARQLKHGYCAATSYTDAQIGRVLDELERLGLRDNTIVVLWGDHGFKLGEHDAWCKHSNCENDANAPLVISAPGMKQAGRSTRALVEFVDIYPTLCDLAGLPLPGHLEGVSMKPLLDDADLPWKTAAFTQYPRSNNGGMMGYSMRTDRHRFTVWVGTGDHAKVHAVELYDHATDPEENQNLANQPAQAALVTELMAQWQRGWQGAKPASPTAIKPGN